MKIGVQKIGVSIFIDIEKLVLNLDFFSTLVHYKVLGLVKFCSFKTLKFNKLFQPFNGGSSMENSV